jgi:hypothetical protein
VLAAENVAAIEWLATIVEKVACARRSTSLGEV